MILVALALLQATVPEQEPAQVQPTSVATEAEADAAEAEAPAPDEPKMKKVCRKVSDPRLGALAARQTRCKYVPLEE